MSYESLVDTMYGTAPATERVPVFDLIFRTRSSVTAEDQLTVFSEGALCARNGLLHFTIREAANASKANGPVAIPSELQ